MRAFYAMLLLASCTATSEDAELAAVQDDVTVEMNTSVDVAVLDNDIGIDESSGVVLATGPAHGDAVVDAAGVLHYAPTTEYLGNDVLEYRIRNAGGSTTVGTVAITVRCATCAIGTTSLAWDPNAPGDNIVGYRMYSGASMDTATLTLLDDVMVTQPGFDPAAPSVTYDSWTKLHLHIGDLVCFALTAYNTAGESGFSNVACKVATLGEMKFGL